MNLDNCVNIKDCEAVTSKSNSSLKTYRDKQFIFRQLLVSDLDTFTALQ